MSAVTFKDFVGKHRTASILLGVSIIFGAAAIYRHGEVPDREKELEEKTTEGRRLQANLTNSSLLRENLSSLIDINKHIAAELVNPNQLGENLQFFYRIEAATSTKIVDLRQTYSPQQAAKNTKSGFVPVPYTVSIQGDYRSVMNFVRRIERSNRIARVTSASLAPSDASDVVGAEAIALSLNLDLLGTP